ncbi:RNA-directed DNA polymerase from mobile element jockey [Trichonephila clavipes]|nr:RNA-directed DNA polymerase from mobile element jockey [Trichonephila clavipes]
MSQNKFELPQGAHLNNLENSGPVANGNNPNVSNNSANQNAPQNQLPPPIMLFVEKNYKAQMAAITKEFPKIRSRLTGEFLKLYTDSAEERRMAVQLLKKLKFQFYTIESKAERPIKVVIKGLPRNTNPEEIKHDLELLGYTPDRVNQLIGRKNKRPLPIFLITLPRDLDNLKLFDLKTLNYLSIRVEGYDGTAVNDQRKANLLATNIKNNFVENDCEDDSYNQNDDLINTTVNNFLSTPPNSYIEPALPDEIIHYIKHVNAKKAPDNWKEAIIFPINKPGKDSHLASSYRPISLLSTFGKLTESIILHRLKNFINENNILNPNQYGFTNKLSILHPLLRITENISEGFQKKKSTGAVFLDIQKAFDRVWINGLTLLS